MTMKKIGIEEITWEISVEIDHIPVRGNAIASGDDKYDRRVENRILKRLENGDPWAWGSVCVTGTWEGIEEREYLGACSYRNEQDFIRSGYYDEMRNSIRDEIQFHADRIAAAIGGDR